MEQLAKATLLSPHFAQNDGSGGQRGGASGLSWSLALPDLAPEELAGYKSKDGRI